MSAGDRLISPDDELHDEGRHEDPPGVSWAEPVPDLDEAMLPERFREGG